MKKQIIKNIFSNYAGRGFGLFFSLLLVPFLIWKLGKEAFGVTVLAESLIRFVDVASSSLRTSLSRHATYSLSKGDKDQFLEYLVTGRVLLFGASLLTLIVGLALSLNLAHILRIPTDLVFESKVLFLLMTAAFVTALPNSVYWSVLYSKQRFDLINFCQSSGVLIRAILTFAVFSFLPEKYHSLILYGAVYVLEAWTENFVVYIWHKRVMPGLKLHWQYFRSSKVREVLSFGMYTSVNNLSAVIYENAMNILINIYWGPAYNAIYGISMKFLVLLRRLFIEPAWTLTPTFTHLAAQNERQKLKTLLFSYSKIMAILSMPVVLLLMIAARPVIRVWVGPDFDLAADIMPLQVVPLLFTIPGATCICVINAYGRVKVPSMVAITSTALRIALGFLFAVHFSMGLMGLVLVSTVINILATIFYSTNYACRVASFSMMSFWKETYLRPLSAGLATVFAAYLLAKYFIKDVSALGPAHFFVLSTCTVLYSLLVFRFVISADEKRYVRELFGKLT